MHPPAFLAALLSEVCNRKNEIKKILTLFYNWFVVERMGKMTSRQATIKTVSHSRTDVEDEIGFFSENAIKFLFFYFCERMEFDPA